MSRKAATYSPTPEEIADHDRALKQRARDEGDRDRRLKNAHNRARYARPELQAEYDEGFGQTEAS